MSMSDYHGLQSPLSCLSAEERGGLSSVNHCSSDGQVISAIKELLFMF